MGIFYSRSYPPKGIKDNRSQFEKNKDNDQNMVHIYRSMLSGGSPNTTLEQVLALENWFEKVYGILVDEYCPPHLLEKRNKWHKQKQKLEFVDDVVALGGLFCRT